MRQADGKFIWFEALVLECIPHIADDLINAWLDEMGQYAYVGFTCPIACGPLPYVLEHSFVQTSKEVFFQHISLAEKAPRVRFSDVFLFELVEF